MVAPTCAKETVIGSGTYGTVVKTEIKGQPVAIKRISLHNHNRVFNNEVCIGFQVKNLQHVIHYKKSYIDGSSGCIVMDFCRTDLFQELCSLPKSLTEKEAAVIFFRICTAVKELHDAGVAHLDLKLDNILVTESNDILLSDFGTSVSFVDGKAPIKKERFGTPIYLAPEVETGGFVPSTADVWSLGVIMHLLLTRRFPVQKHCTFVSARNLRITGSKSKVCRDLLKRILKINPSERISMEEILRHPWFTSFSSSR